MRVQIEQAGGAWEVSEGDAVVESFENLDQAVDGAALLFRAHNPAGAAALLLSFGHAGPARPVDLSSTTTARGEPGP